MAYYSATEKDLYVAVAGVNDSHCMANFNSSHPIANVSGCRPESKVGYNALIHRSATGITVGVRPIKSQSLVSSLKIKSDVAIEYMLY